MRRARCDGRGRHAGGGGGRAPDRPCPWPIWRTSPRAADALAQRRDGAGAAPTRGPTAASRSPRDDHGRPGDPDARAVPVHRCEPGAVTVQAGGLIEHRTRLMGGLGSADRGASTPPAAPRAGAGRPPRATSRCRPNIVGAFTRAADSHDRGRGAVSMTPLRHLSSSASSARPRPPRLHSQHWASGDHHLDGLDESPMPSNRVPTQRGRAHSHHRTGSATRRPPLRAPRARRPRRRRAPRWATAKIAVRTAQDDLTRARQRLTHAHDEFTHWQDRARRIRDTATTEGEGLAAALLLITIAPPPLPGTLHYPTLQPTPQIIAQRGSGRGAGWRGQGRQGRRRQGRQGRR